MKIRSLDGTELNKDFDLAKMEKAYGAVNMAKYTRDEHDNNMENDEI